MFQTQLIKLLVSINSTKAFYLRKVSWKIKSFFLFQPISKFDMENKIQNINLKKETTKNTIAPKTLKVRAEFSQVLFNQYFMAENIPDQLKLADKLRKLQT